MSEQEIRCPDCGKMVIPEKDPCPIHSDCGEFAYICPECGTLNIDWYARGCPE